MTAAGKITTARLVPGSRILVTETLAEARGLRVLDVAFRKTGSVVATVERVEVVGPTPGYGRQSRRRILTDRGELVCSPSQTHRLAPAAIAPLAAAEEDAAVEGIVAAVRVDLGDYPGGRVSNSVDHVV